MTTKNARKDEAVAEGTVRAQRRSDATAPRATRPADLDELSLDLSDLGETHVVESRPAPPALAPALPLAFDPSDMGESPPPRAKVTEISREKSLTPAKPHSAPLVPEAPPVEPSKTHFSSSIGQPRLEFDSSEELENPPPEELPSQPHVPSGQLRLRLEQATTDALRRFRELPGWLAARRSTLRKPKPKGEPSSTPRRDRAAQPTKQLSHRAKGPLAGAVVVALVYAGAAQVLGSAPWQDRGPAIPDLGGSTTELSPETPTPQRDFRIEGDGKPGETSQSKSIAAAAPAPNVAAPPLFQVEPFPSDATFPGKSLLEVVTSDEELIYVDGVFIGRGPLRRIPLSQGQHAVAIRSGGAERGGQFDAPVGRMVRASFVSIPSGEAVE